jgi:mannose-6-phosphate isomerase-like protein (cupin superfamily)
MNTTARLPYALPKDDGVTDVWFPLWEGRYITKTAAEQTEGCLLQLLITEPRGAAPPLHIHHDADETWYVIEGRMIVFVGDERFEAGPGDFVLGPKGITHSYLVTSERAKFLVSFVPAGTKGLAGYGVDGFFREIGLPVAPGESHPGLVSVAPEEFARKAGAYGIEIAGPPPTLD